MQWRIMQASFLVIVYCPGFTKYLCGNADFTQGFAEEWDGSDTAPLTRGMATVTLRQSQSPAPPAPQRGPRAAHWPEDCGEAGSAPGWGRPSRVQGGGWKLGWGKEEKMVARPGRHRAAGGHRQDRWAAGVSEEVWWQKKPTSKKQGMLPAPHRGAPLPVGSQLPPCPLQHHARAWPTETWLPATSAGQAKAARGPGLRARRGLPWGICNPFPPKRRDVEFGNSFVICASLAKMPAGTPVLQRWMLQHWANRQPLCRDPSGHGWMGSRCLVSSSAEVGLAY